MSAIPGVPCRVSSTHIFGVIMHTLIVVVVVTLLIAALVRLAKHRAPVKTVEADVATVVADATKEVEKL